jgi:hypothetical protein
MKVGKIGEWLHVIGNFGVLAGLILVALQIQQNTVLVRAELLSNEYDAWISIDASKQSERFASVLAKSIVNPQELNAAEILELDGYLFTYIDQLVRDRELYELGVFDNPLESQISGSLSDYFGNQFARVWWEETKWKFDLEIVEIIDREMEKISVTQDIDYIERIKATLSE